MLHLTAETSILLAVQPVDFRKQIDGLVALCQRQLALQPRSAGLIVFINRARTMLRVLCYEDNGYWLATKRLSRGRYTRWPTQDRVLQPLQAFELTRMLKGVIAYDTVPV